MDWTWTYNKTFSSQVELGVELIRTLISHLESKQWPPKDVFGIHMAMEEAVMNAIKHGNQRDPSKDIHVVLKTCDDKLLFVKVTDEGDGFDPNAVLDCTADENLEKICGRGLMLMKSYMDSVEYNSKGNSVEMTKARPS